MLIGQLYNLSLIVEQIMKAKSWTGYLLIFPAILIIMFVFLYPIIEAFDMSLQDIILTRPQSESQYIGFTNYANLINNEYFWNSVRITGIWLIANLICQMIFGLLIALLLNNEYKGRSIFRGLMLIPWATPSVVAVLSWRWMFDAQFGIINAALVRIGIMESGIAWLGNVSTSLVAVTIESIWKGTPFVMVIILAGLQTIPEEIYEAAEVDGANYLNKLWYIILPMLVPSITIAITLTMIYTFNNFNSIWLITEGGPLRATETLTILVYSLGFRSFNLGEASALGIIILFMLIMLTVISGRHYFRSRLINIS